MNKKIYSILSILIFSVIVSCGKDPKEDKKQEVMPIQETAQLRSEEDIINFGIEKSSISWEGKAITKSHDGSLQFKKAQLYVDKNDGMYGGHFIVDMNSLKVLDLEGDDKLSLEGHLKGTIEGKEDHFFDVKKFPTASLEIVLVDRVDEYSYTVVANLTMKNETQQVKFLCKLGLNEATGKYSFKTERIKVDRTKFGIKFMSSNFFDGLGDKAINDEIMFSVNLES
jgi:polyisoprenoid-binding protein YceI